VRLSARLIIGKTWAALDPVFERCALCAAPLRTRSALGVLCPGCAPRLPQRTTGFCPGCGLFYDNEDPPYACIRCRSGPQPLAGLGFYSGYQGALRELLLDFKFHSRLGLARLLDILLGRALETHFPGQGFDLVVPVPAHTLRLLRRGFNQSLVLARMAGRRLATPVDGHALRRTRHTPPQSGLTKAERESNLAGAFAARESRCGGKRILLVDDVATTGSTLGACARTLKRAGASTVHALVLAKA
jgi:ComF family protein